MKHSVTSVVGQDQHTTGRLPFWDVLKLFLIFLVIWGHCIKGFSTSDCADSTVYRAIYSFHMPMFMMISGYFSTSSMSMSLKNFLRKKFWTLLYPCFIWGAILWCVLESLNSFHYGSKEFSVPGLFSDFYWLSDFWFLKSCFVCYVLAYVGLHFPTKRTFMVPATLVLSQFVSLFFVSFMYPCFLVGIALRQYASVFDWINRHKLSISIIFLLMLFLWDEQMWKNSHGIPSNILASGIDTWLKIFYARLFRLLIGIMGSLTFIVCFRSIFKNGNKSKMIRVCSDLGQYTLCVYILQRVLLEYGLAYLVCLDNIGTMQYEVIATPLISALLLLAFSYVAKLMSQSLILEKWLWGKRSAKAHPLAA